MLAQRCSGIGRGATELTEADANAVDALVAQHPPELQAIEHRLRSLIFELYPDVREYVDTGNGLLGYASGPAMRDLLFAIIAHRSHVNLQFADGASLPDPDGLVEGTGKRIRHVKVRDVEEADRPAVRALVEEQLRLRGLR